VAIGFELLWFTGYVVLFRHVFRREVPRLGGRSRAS
jgi:hypothetical protein